MKQKGLVDHNMEKRSSDFMQYKKGYVQALKDVQEWISEEYGTGRKGDIEYVTRRIEAKLK